jgi:hypothetical protein
VKHLPLALVAILLVMLVAEQFGDGSAAKIHAEQAKAWEDSAAVRATRTANLEAANATLTTAKEAADAKTAADSIARAQSDAQNHARLAAANRRASEAAESLEAALDSAETVLFATYRAGRDSVEAVKDLTIEALEARDVQRVAQIDARDALIASLHETLEAKDAELVALTEANAALHRQVGALKRQGWLWKGAAVVEGGLLAYVAVRGSPS